MRPNIVTFFVILNAVKNLEQTGRRYTYRV